MWEINGKDNWVLRDETGHIIGIIDIDEQYFSTDKIVTIRLLGKKTKREYFKNMDNALRYVEKIIGGK